MHQAMNDLQDMSLSPADRPRLDLMSSHTFFVHSDLPEGRNYGRDCIGGLNTTLVSMVIPSLASGYLGNILSIETAVTSGFYANISCNAPESGIVDLNAWFTGNRKVFVDYAIWNFYRASLRFFRSFSCQGQGSA